MLSRRAVIAWPDIRTGAIKGIFPIDPARDRPPTLVIAVTVLLADDFDVHYVVASMNDGTCLDQRHCGSAGRNNEVLIKFVPPLYIVPSL